MKRKKQVLKFLEDNAIMINCLMSPDECRTFHGDVVSLLEKEIKEQIRRDENCKKMQCKVEGCLETC